MSKIFKTRMVVGLVVALLLTLSIHLLSHSGIKELVKSRESVEKSLVLKNDLEEVKSALTINESGIRGYAVSGSAIFLDQSHVSSKEIHNLLGKIEEHLEPGSVHERNFQYLKTQIKAKLDWSNHLLQASEGNDLKKVQRLIASGTGKVMMDRCRFYIDAIIQTEQKNLTLLLTESGKNSQRTKNTLVLSSIFFLVLVSIGGYYVIRESDRSIELQQKIKENERRLWSFLDTLPNAVIVIDSNKKVMFFNSEVKEVLGPSIYTGMPIDELYSKMIFTEMNHDLLGTSEELADESNYELKTFQVKANHRHLLLETRTRAIQNEKGEPDFTITIFNDITKRQEAATELKLAKETAENLVQTQERFITNISHEIRTPMNAILGFSNLILRTEITPVQKEYCTAIKSSGENLLSIINDILDVSKIQAGMMVFESIPFSIRALFESVRNMLSAKASEKGLVLTFTQGEDIPEVVMGDPTRLTQILVNLTSNAIKFCDHGKVEFSAAMIEDKNDNLMIRFDVRDTGIGIPEDKIDTIFNRFAQASSDTTRKYGGSGLGLNIVKNLVELQGGTISVKSTEGLGSVFSFIIPYKPAGDVTIKQKLSSQEVQDSRYDDKHILLVEDNYLNQKLASAVLESLGFKLVIAQNGQEAVDILSKEKFDLILMDLQMPVMDGYTASEHIRLHVNKHIPIIAMTAHAMPGEKEKCLSYGMNDYVSKPFNEKELLKKINYYLTKENSKNRAKIVNLDYLRGLSIANPGFIKEILQTFSEEAPALVNRLSLAVKAKDLTEIKNTCHILRSNLESLGATLPTSHIQLMEHAALEGVTAFKYDETFREAQLLISDMLDEVQHLVTELI